MRKLTILSVAFPFSPVGPASVGGAEQVLYQIDSALIRAGHQSIVIACKGSRTQGDLLETADVDRTIDEGARKEAHRLQLNAIEHALRRYPVDVIHFHGLDFCNYLPPRSDRPELVSLHLPPSWYDPESFSLERPKLWLHCVSRTQQSRCPPCPRMLDPVPNGVPIEALTPTDRAWDYVASLGRICPEKGFHLGLRASKKARTMALLAGKVFPYREHQKYFEERLRPLLDRERRFIGPVGARAKRGLLARARALLIPSLVEETSSLVAMEALACGTPVIAHRIGALEEIIEQGRTGFLVRNEDEMAAAIRDVAGIDRGRCRSEAAARYSVETMTRRYLAIYRNLAGV